MYFPFRENIIMIVNNRKMGVKRLILGAKTFSNHSFPFKKKLR